MTSRGFRLRRIAAAAALPLLASCGSAPTRIFTLYPVAPTSTAPGAAPLPIGTPQIAIHAYSGAPVRVDAVHVPPAWDRIELIDSVATGELKIDDLDHWSAPLGQEARQALSADLLARLPLGKVIFPHLVKPEGALGLSVDVLDFRAGHDVAYLQASWLVSSSQPKLGALAGTVSLRTEVSGAGPAATAQALSLLLAQLADRIVADLGSGAN